MCRPLDEQELRIVELEERIFFLEKQIDKYDDTIWCMVNELGIFSEKYTAIRLKLLEESE